jgi:hypothetical protein
MFVRFSARAVQARRRWVPAEASWDWSAWSRKGHPSLISSMSKSFAATNVDATIP